MCIFVQQGEIQILCWQSWLFVLLVLSEFVAGRAPWSTCYFRRGANLLWKFSIAEQHLGMHGFPKLTDKFEHVLFFILVFL